jgi:hypothetical protein
MTMKHSTLLICTLIITLSILVISNSSLIVRAQYGVAFWMDTAYSKTGEEVTSPPLEAGTNYLIVAQGRFWYNYSGDSYFLADCMYYSDSSTEWANNYPCPGGHSFLQMNNQDVNWGSFNNESHLYSLNVIGRGEPVTFRVFDWIDQNISNNYCHIDIAIYEKQVPHFPRALPSESNIIVANLPTPVPTQAPTSSQPPAPPADTEVKESTPALFTLSLTIALILVLGLSAFIIMYRRKRFTKN